MLGTGAATALVVIVVALITGLVGWLLKLGIQCANSVVSAIMGTELTTFAANGNLLKIFEDFFTDFNLKVGNNLAQVIMYMSFFLILLFTIFEVINSMTAGLQGEQAENPLKILARGVITLVLELIIFGMPFNASGGIDPLGDSYTAPIYGETEHYDQTCLLISSSGNKPTDMSNCDGHHGGTMYGFKIVDDYDYIPIIGYQTITPSNEDSAYFSTGKTSSLISAFGSAMNEFLRLVFPSSVDFTNNNDTFTSVINGMGIVGLVVTLILQFALFKNIIQMTIVFIERYLSFAFYILMGPLAVACNATTKTKNTFHDWLIGVLSQFLTIFVSLAALRMYASCWNNFDPKSIQSGADISVKLILFYCLCLALVALVTNSEKIVNALGFRTIMNGDTARSWAVGARSAGMAFRMTAGRALTQLGMGAARNVEQKALHEAAVKSQAIANHHNNRFTQGFANIAGKNDVFRNSQMGMEGNNFKTAYANKNYKWDNYSQQMNYVGKGTERAKYAEARKELNDFYSGKKNTIDMKKAAPILGIDSVGNMEYTKVGYAVTNSEGQRDIMFGAKMKDGEGQLHTYNMVASMNNALGNGSSLTNVDYKGNSVDNSAFEINKKITGTENGINYYSIEDTQLLSQNDYEKAHPEAFDDGAEYDQYKDDVIYYQEKMHDVLNDDTAWVRNSQDFDVAKELGIGYTGHEMTGIYKNLEIDKVKEALKTTKDKKGN